MAITETPASFQAKQVELAKTLKGTNPPVPTVTLDEIQAGDSVIALVYGGSGAGKTPFLGSAGSRSVIIDTGHGLETLKSPKFRERYPDHKPIIAVINEVFNSDGSPQAKGFDLISETIDWHLDNRSDDFDTICIDEMSATRRMAMFKGLELSSDSGRSNTKASVSKNKGIVVPAIQDFGMEMNIIEWLIGTYSEVCRQAGKHLLIAAHERITYKMPTNDKGAVLIGQPPVVEKKRPAFTGRSQPDDIVAYFDEVWYIEAVNTQLGNESRIYPYGDGIVSAKSRHAGVFGNIELKPDFLDFVKRIKEAKKYVFTKPK